MLNRERALELKKSERSEWKARGVGCGVRERSEKEAGIQFSRDSIRAFNDRIKIRENRKL